MAFFDSAQDCSLVSVAVEDKIALQIGETSESDQNPNVKGPKIHLMSLVGRKSMAGRKSIEETISSLVRLRL
jgi:hypothetical protein